MSVKTTNLGLEAGLDEFLVNTTVSGVKRTRRITLENAAAVLAASTALTAWVGSKVKEFVSSNRTYEIDATASPGGDGSSGAPFQSITEGWNWVVRHLYAPNGIVITLNCEGTFAAWQNCIFPVEGGGRIDVVSNRVGGNIFGAAAATLSAGIYFAAGAYGRLGGFDISSATYGLWAIDGGTIVEVFFNVFGVCVEEHMYATRGARIEQTADQGFTGGAKSHVQSSHQGNWRRSVGQIVALADVTFSRATLYSEGASDLTITGTGTVFNANGHVVTGVKLRVDMGSYFQYSLLTTLAGGWNLILGSILPQISQGAIIYTGQPELNVGPFVADGPPWLSDGTAPTITTVGGALGSGNVPVGQFQFHGKNCKFRRQIAIGASGAGTASGILQVTLPAGVTAVALGHTPVLAYRSDRTHLVAFIPGGANYIEIHKVDLSTPVANSMTIFLAGEVEYA